MRYIVLIVFALTLSANAAEECIFDQKAQADFISRYLEAHAEAHSGGDTADILIKRGNERILFSRGGCMDFGISITSNAPRVYSEKEFLAKVLALVEEFGTELVEIKALKTALSSRSWEIYNGTYFVKLEGLASFEMSHNGKGEVYVGFYIN